MSLPALENPIDRAGEESPGGLSEREEASLVARAKLDPRAFGLLFEAYYARVLNFLYRCTQDTVVAEDLTSNTFLQALRALPRYDRRAPFLAWLFRIALNEVRMHWRRTARNRRRVGALLSEEPLERVYFEVSSLETEECIREKAEAFAQVRQAVEMLPEKYRGALVLRFYEGFAYETIAEVLEKRVGTVKSLVHRGIKRLGKILDQDATWSWPRH